MIDLRSDTVTRPSAEMLQAMVEAPTGDDVFGEDPTVSALEAKAADMLGKAAGLFVTSGTQGNLLALLAHCQRGDEYIAGQDAHTYRFEAGGGAVLGSIQPQPLPFNERGELDLAQVEEAIKPDNVHFARTRLLCLENTQGGKPLSADYLAAASDLADRRGLKKHLDGARVFNAAVKQGVPVSEISCHFDTVSFCLSKGLAAPVGSVLVGDEETIAEARKWRKMLGGGMRQAGVLAAAGIYALDNNIERLAEDHKKAEKLYAALSQLSMLKPQAPPQTNMLFLDIGSDVFARLQPYLAEHGVTVGAARWVLHRDVSDEDVDKVIELCQAFEQDE